MESSRTLGAHGDNAANGSPSGEPSVSSSLEHLVAGSQGVITKRIDLAFLEGEELLSRFIERAALVGAGIIVAAMAWFAGAGALVLFVVPAGNPILRLAVFALLNGVGASGLVTFALRHSRPPAQAHSNDHSMIPRAAREN